MGAPHQQRGITLVEILVVIGVVGILIGLTAPALMRAFGAAGQTKSLANARSLALLIAQHVEANQQMYPALELGRRYPATARARTSKIYDEPTRLWNAAHLWPGVITRGQPWVDSADAWFSPRTDMARALQTGPATSCAYSNSFVGRPEIWSSGTTPTPDMIAPVRAHEVAHPSRKALLWDDAIAYAPEPAPLWLGLPGEPLPIAFADLHAAVRLARDARSPVENQLGDHSWRAAPLHNTPDGVLGWDY